LPELAALINETNAKTVKRMARKFHPTVLEMKKAKARPMMRMPPASPLIGLR